MHRKFGSKARKGLLALFGIALGLGLLWASLHNIDTSEIHRVGSDINRGWVVAGMVAYSAGVVLRIARWRALLTQLVPVTLRDVATTLVVGYAVNNILPARLGELFRADFAKRRIHLERSAALGAILVERTFDGLTVVGMLCVGLVGYGATVTTLGSDGLATFQLIASIGLILFGLAAAAVVVAGEHAHWGSALPHWLRRRAQKFADGLRTLNSASLLRLCLLSALIWLMETTALMAVLRSVAVILEPAPLMILTGAAALSTLIPTAPGYVGSYQYVFALSMTTFGFAAVAGVVAATIVQVALYGGLTLLGIALYALANLQYALKQKPRLQNQSFE